MVQRLLRAGTGVAHRASEGREPPQENFRKAAGDRLVTSHRLMPRPAVLTPCPPVEMWIEMWPKSTKNRNNSCAGSPVRCKGTECNKEATQNRGIQGECDQPKHPKFSVMLQSRSCNCQTEISIQQTIKKHLRFLHVLTLWGVWWSSGGVSPVDSPKLDKTSSILIISASTRGLTEGKPSSSTAPRYRSESPGHTQKKQKQHF